MSTGIRTTTFIGNIFLLSIFLFSCKYDNIDYTPNTSGYPQEIATIIVNKCANAGCHNPQSKDGAAGLSLETWKELFDGGRNGAAVIPYRPDYSTLLFFTNTDTLLGIKLEPNMPYNSTPLSLTEYTILKNWISKGAPDVNGFVKFSDNPNRQKVYVSNQSADVVTVIDVESNLIMRYIDVGETPLIEVPHIIKTSPDSKYWYAPMYIGSILQKFRTSDNALVAAADIGIGNWNSFTISDDSKNAFVVDLGSGQIAVVDLENMSGNSTWQGFDNPHGSALNKNGDTIYVTSQFGNFIYKIPVNDHLNFTEISLNSLPPSTVASLDPHEILFNEDHSQYYITCERSNEVRVMQTSNDSLIATIPTSEFPVEMSMSNTKPYLFVTCLSAINSGSSVLGRVDVIDMYTNTNIKSIMSGHQPHGLAVCDEKNKVYVANRNTANGGPPSHHPTTFGKNGYVTMIDMSTLELVPDFKIEVSGDPYSVTITR